MIGADVLTSTIFIHMINFQGKYGNTIGNAAWGLGVNCFGPIDHGPRHLRQDSFIELFDQVVALLVEPVNGTLYGSDLTVVHIRTASLVFFVPEKEVTP